MGEVRSLFSVLSIPKGGQKVAAFVGESGSGKTFLITSLIRRLVGRGLRVAAIKHTHHPVNEQRKGDTAQFAEAGADPVILAGDATAVVFERAAIEHVNYESPQDLLARADAEIVLIEGFKQYEGWPRIELDPSRRMTNQEAEAILDRIWHQ